VSFGSAKVFEDYARDCVNRAKQAAIPELRDMLLDMAREWMQIATEEEDWAKRITSSYLPHTHPTAG
jgi:hypothetical protein